MNPPARERLVVCMRYGLGGQPTRLPRGRRPTRLLSRNSVQDPTVRCSSCLAIANRPEWLKNETTTMHTGLGTPASPAAHSECRFVPNWVCAAPGVAIVLRLWWRM